MSSIKQEIFGGFKSTVGTVVGTSRKVKSILCGMAQSVGGPQSRPQLGQHGKLVTASSFIRSIKSASDTGHRNMGKSSLSTLPETAATPAEPRTNHLSQFFARFVSSILIFPIFAV